MKKNWIEFNSFIIDAINDIYYHGFGQLISWTIQNPKISREFSCLLTLRKPFGYNTWSFIHSFTLFFIWESHKCLSEIIIKIKMSRLPHYKATFYFFIATVWSPTLKSAWWPKCYLPIYFLCKNTCYKYTLIKDISNNINKHSMQITHLLLLTFLKCLSLLLSMPKSSVQGYLALN